MLSSRYIPDEKEENGNKADKNEISTSDLFAFARSKGGKGKRKK